MYYAQGAASIGLPASRLESVCPPSEREKVTRARGYDFPERTEIVTRRGDAGSGSANKRDPALNVGRGEGENEPRLILLAWLARHRDPHAREKERDGRKSRASATRFLFERR